MQYVSPVMVKSALNLFAHLQLKFSDVNVFYFTCFYGISLKVLMLKGRKVQDLHLIPSSNWN